MKSNSILLGILVFVAVVLFSSCAGSRSAFPRDPYRGSSANPRSYPQPHQKAKATRQYRSIRVRPTY